MRIGVIREAYARPIGRRVSVAFSLAIAIVVMANAMFAERIRFNDGLGFGDGRLYASIARDPVGATIGRGLDSYALQRVLPAVIVGAALHAARLEPSNANVVDAFEVLGAVLVIAATFAWSAVARQLQLTVGPFLLGGIACFVNFAQMKQLPYYATLTDTSAFALGMLLIYFYVRKSLPGLALTALAAGFVWPVAVPLALPMLLWSRGVRPVPRSSEQPADLGTIVAAGIVAILIIGFAYVYLYRGFHVVGFGPVPPVVSTALPVSALLYWSFSFLALRALLRGIDLQWVVALVRDVTVQRASVAIGLVAFTRLTVALLQKPESVPTLPLRIFAGFLAITPLIRPLVWIVAHFVYFGPWVLVVILRWSSIADIARREGAAMVAFVTGATILGFLPESRQSIFALPAFALLLALLAQQERFDARLLALLGVAAVAATKIWLTIGPGDIDNLAAFRRYFMNHGVYMDAWGYTVQGLIAALLAIPVWLLTRSTKEYASAPTGGLVAAGE